MSLCVEANRVAEKIMHKQAFPMDRWRVRWTLLAVVVLTGGCASGLSKDECRTADWGTIGYEDGVQGRPESMISSHRQSCAKHDVSFDLAAYQSGRDRGLVQYCEPRNGYRQGRSGRAYAGVCPGHLEGGFLDAYAEGRALYDAESDLRRTERLLEARHRRLHEIEIAMRDTGLDLVQPGLTTEQRIVLLDDLRRLEAERAAINDEMPELEADLDRQARRLERLQTAQRY
jgi:hypothetical protein